MTKMRSQIDIVPFYPARQRAARAAEMLVLICTVFAGISAASIVLLSRFGGAGQ